MDNAHRTTPPPSLPIGPIAFALVDLMAERVRRCSRRALYAAEMNGTSVALIEGLQAWLAGEGEIPPALHAELEADKTREVQP